jgi:hypothetical protein
LTAWALAADQITSGTDLLTILLTTTELQPPEHREEHRQANWLRDVILGRQVHAVREPASGPQVGEVQSVVQAGDDDQAIEHLFASAPAPRPELGHAVQSVGSPSGLFQQLGTTAGHHLVAEPQRPGQQHRGLCHVTSSPVPGR